MATCTPARARPLSRLRRWLRHTWVSRLDLLAWWAGLGEWLRGPDERKRERRPPFRPDMERLEWRETPDDLLGMLQVPLVLGGVPLIAGTLPTPGAAFLRGWSGGLAAAPAETPPPTSAAAGALDAGLGAGEEAAQLSAWQFSSQRTAAPGAASDGAGAVSSGQSDVRLALAVGATGLGPLRMGGVPRSAEDLLGNPLGDDWLASVGAALEAARLRRAGPAAPDDHSGGGGGSGDSGPGSPMADRGSAGGGGSAAAPPAVTAAQAAAMLGSGTGTVTPAPAGPQPLAAPAPVSAGPVASTAAVAPSSPAPPPVAPAGGGPGGSGSTPIPAALLPGYGQAPLPFEPNVGQTDPQVRFLSHGPGFALFLTDTAAVFDVPVPGTQGRDPARYAFRLQLDGANASPQIVAQHDLLSRSNYFTGTGASGWHADVPNYGEVDYRGVYPGVDLAYHSAAQRQFEYDFVVAPGADPAAIHLNWQGLQSVGLDKQGNLLLGAGGATVTQQAPAAYQVVNGVKQPVGAHHVLLANGDVGFQLGAYDHTKPLVIDPVIAYGSYLGGSGDDKAYGIAVDGDGSAYLTGVTGSCTFPTANGLQSFGGPTDAFVTKLNPGGNALVYSTFLGGTAADQGNGIAVDAAGVAYVVGTTSSTNFPTANAFQTGVPGTSAAFVSVLSPTGDDLYYSTTLRPSSSSSFATGTAIAVEVPGTFAVTGAAGSGFPTQNAYQSSFAGSTQDAYVAAFSLAPGTMNLLYSTYLGGDGSAAGQGIAADSHGNVCVTGSTTGWTSTPFPTTAGAYQTK
jgi:hypothetical protein